MTRELDLSLGTRLYVPAADSSIRSFIAQGSGIVGTVYGMGRIQIYYEGGIYHQAGMETWEDRAYHAWDRCVQRYPTVAMALVDAGELVEVGEVVPQPGRRPLFVVTDRAALDAWCGDA